MRNLRHMVGALWPQAEWQLISSWMEKGLEIMAANIPQWVTNWGLHSLAFPDGVSCHRLPFPHISLIFLCSGLLPMAQPSRMTHDYPQSYPPSWPAPQSHAYSTSNDNPNSPTLRLSIHACSKNLALSFLIWPFLLMTLSPSQIQNCINYTNPMRLLMSCQIAQCLIHSKSSKGAAAIIFCYILRLVIYIISSQQMAKDRLC